MGLVALEGVRPSVPIAVISAESNKYQAIKLVELIHTFLPKQQFNIIIPDKNIANQPDIVHRDYEVFGGIMKGRSGIIIIGSKENKAVEKNIIECAYNFNFPILCLGESFKYLAEVLGLSVCTKKRDEHKDEVHIIWDDKSILNGYGGRDFKLRTLGFNLLSLFEVDKKPDIFVEGVLKEDNFNYEYAEFFSVSNKHFCVGLNYSPELEGNYELLEGVVFSFVSICRRVVICVCPDEDE